MTTLQGLADASTNRDRIVVEQRAQGPPVQVQFQVQENSIPAPSTSACASASTSTRKRQRRPASGLPAIHQCRICQRTYERADRLSRHLRTHENARRHVCARCEKSFNRADLLSRHVLTHNRNDAGSDPSAPSSHRTERAGQACSACALAKARCEDRKPCQRCQRKNLTCEITSQSSDSAQWHLSGYKSDQSQSSSTGSVSPHPSEQPQQQQTTLSFPEQQQRQQQQQQYAPNDATLAKPQPGMLPEGSESIHINLNSKCNSRTDQAVNQHDNASVQHAGTGRASNVREPVPAQLDSQGMSLAPLGMDENQLVFDNVLNEILFMPNAADFNNQNLDFSFYDFAFHHADLHAPLVPISGSRDSEAAPIESADRTPRLNPVRDVRAGYAAFTRSPWLWTPASRDGVLRDGEDHLALAEGSVSSALTPKPLGLTPNVPSCGYPVFSATTRDKMYYLVATMAKYNDRVPDFPSLDIVNHIMEAFFVKQSYQVDNWIHVPSLSPAEIIPHLGLAMVIAGSTVISVPAIWKMGLVLQDVVRVKLGELWELDNSATRNLQPLQAWMLTLDAGLWSGFQRQMELAESFGQTIITMMRRGGMFGTTANTQALIPQDSDTGEVLEAKWKKWTERESIKRLSIHLFLHDTRASIALQKPPLLSVTEIAISLPASRPLFLAGSAAEWKSCFHWHTSSQARPACQLVNLMHDMSILDDLHSEVDVSLCQTAAIHGFWSQIWAFRESWKLHAIGETGDSVHRLWLTTQQRELYRQIEAFEPSLLCIEVPQPELLIVVELMLMILHVSPEELQRFAGRYGEEAASQAFTNLEKWWETEHAKRAVWHAGQVFRWSSMMPSAELRDFYAVAVYFASLALWAYGHLSNNRDTSNRLKHQKQGRFVDGSGPDHWPLLVINSDEPAGARSFMAGRPTTPVLSPVPSRLGSSRLGIRDDGLIRVDSPNAVLQMARDLYRNNFPIDDEPLPSLVENMGNLIRDLGGLSQNRFSRCVSPVER